MCVRTMAKNWEFVEEWERNNLADLPVRLRMSLLSDIAVYGPGITLNGLLTILRRPIDQEGDKYFDSDGNNDGFYRLDVSGSVGRTISLKEIRELIEPPAESNVPVEQLDWEEIPRTLSAPIPHLTHLSLSHPPPSISWPRLLRLATYLPTLTHLSLAYWPAPMLTPNAKTAVVESPFGRNIQYGGTNYYSHTLDNDYRESATILRTLALRMYGLEYLDLTGCTAWLRALRYRKDTDNVGLDWSAHWVKLRQLILYSGLVLSEELSGVSEVDRYVRAVEESIAIGSMMADVRRARPKGKVAWVDVVRDDPAHDYGHLWREHAPSMDTMKKRAKLDGIDYSNKLWSLDIGSWDDTVVVVDASWDD